MPVDELFTGNGWSFGNLIFSVCAIALYSPPFCVWYHKQTLFSAALVSFTGLFADPGIIFILFTLDDYKRVIGIITILLTCVSYLLLFIGNKVQKKYYPENRFGNRLRVILKAPCLRT